MHIMKNHSLSAIKEYFVLCTSGLVFVFALHYVMYSVYNKVLHRTNALKLNKKKPEALFNSSWAVLGTF